LGVGNRPSRPKRENGKKFKAEKPQQDRQKKKKNETSGPGALSARKWVFVVTRGLGKKGQGTAQRG